MNQVRVGFKITSHRGLRNKPVVKADQLGQVGGRDAFVGAVEARQVFNLRTDRRELVDVVGEPLVMPGIGAADHQTGGHDGAGEQLTHRAFDEPI